MLLKNMKQKIQGEVKTWEGKRILYTHPDEVYKLVSPEDWEKIRNWQRICIFSSPEGTRNKCFSFYWGYGGNPDYVLDIDLHYINEEDNDRFRYNL